MGDMFDHLPLYVDDPILGLFEKYKVDERPFKVNLGIGIYCDEDGNVPLLQSVRAARRAHLEGGTPSVYLPTEGDEIYRSVVCDLVFGSPANSRISVVQTVAGTGALKIGADFLKDTLPSASIWMPNPTWANHGAVFESAGFATHSYPYYDPQSGQFDLEGALAVIGGLQAGSVLLLHPCCHNPTGVDPTQAQWSAILDSVERRGLLPFFDMAYQGFAEGVDEDAWVVRECVRRGIGCLVASSFSKIFSLYGDRVGALSVFSPTGDTERIVGRLKLTIRRSYSCPPAAGSAVVRDILGNPTWNSLWRGELGAMRSRMREMRMGLHALLKEALPERSFDYLVEQNGMFSYSRLSPIQIQRLRQQHGVYVVSSGRLCVAGLNRKNLSHVCDSLVQVSRSDQ